MKRIKIKEPELTENAKEIARKRYLRTDLEGNVLETPGEMLWRVATHMAKAEVNWSGNGKVMEVAKQFYDRMVEMKMVCAGKAMFEAGNPGGTGQLSSCFVLPVEDSIKSIFKTLGDAAVVHKNNGGTGFNFSKIRPHGDKVKNVPGAASGPVDFIKAYSAALAQILQGAKRQGANIAILNVDHPDILDFIYLKDRDGTIKNFNLSVGITDEFMEAVKQDKMWKLVNPRNGEVVRRMKARKLFNLIAEQAWKTGDPGLAFLDTMERGNTVPGFGKLEATNPCVTGDTWVTTEQGLIRIDELVELSEKQEVMIGVDGRLVNEEGKVKLVKPSQVIYTGIKEVWELITRHGYRLKATPDHKVMTKDGWKRLDEIREGNEILIQNGEGGFSDSWQLPFEWKNRVKGKNGRKYKFNLPTRWTEELGLWLGWLVGDGFARVKKNEQGKEKGYVVLSFGNKANETRDYFKQLMESWELKVNELRPTQRTRQLKVNSKLVVSYLENLGLSLEKAEEKRIPRTIFRAPRTIVIAFLRGLFGADGTIGYVKDKSAYVRLTSKSKVMLEEVQLLLLQLGIYSKIYDRSREERQDIFPEYIHRQGEVKRYKSDGRLWELEVAKDLVVRFLDEIGFPFGMKEEKVKKLRAKGYYHNYFVDKVAKINKLGKEKVYDITEPLSHSFLANGIVVHNCGEIALFPYESCNLTSLDLACHLKKVTGDEGQVTRWEVDWEELRKSVHLGVRFLDDMIEVNNYPLKEIEETVRWGNRRIGLGVMGFAHALYKMGVPYNSEKAVSLAKKYAKFIYTEAVKASMELAKERGNFPNWDLSIYAAKKQPMRNCAVCMIAPTGTTSLLANTSSGIEPVFSLVTIRRTFYEDDRSNHSTKELVIVDPVLEESLKRRIKDKQKREEVLRQIAEGDLQGLTKEERKVFVTTHQIEPEWHVRVQAAWQKYFDNSISKTINFSHEATVEEVKRAYWMAWESGCKGITIYRDGSKEDQVLIKSQKSKVKSQNYSSKPISNNSDKSNQEMEFCPECGGRLQRVEGCLKCYDCGWSACG